MDSYKFLKQFLHYRTSDLFNYVNILSFEYKIYIHIYIYIYIKWREKKPGRPRKQERRHRHSEYLTPEHFKLWNKVKSDSIFKLSTNSDFAKALLGRFLSPGHALFSGKTS